MIRLNTKDRSELAAIVKIHCAVPMLEAFDIVDNFCGALARRGYSVLPPDVVASLDAAGAQAVDPVNGLLPTPNRAVLVPYLTERGWKAGEPWTRG